MKQKGNDPFGGLQLVLLVIVVLVDTVLYMYGHPTLQKTPLHILTLPYHEWTSTGLPSPPSSYLSIITMDGQPDPTLMAEDQTLETLLTPTYWRSLCPTLHVSNEDFLQHSHHGLGDELPSDSLRSLIDRDGYFVVEPRSLPWAVNVKDMAEGVKRLVMHGWDPLFLAGE